MKEFFELTKRYEFDIHDITATIYTICAVLGMSGLNPTIPFFIGSAISTAFCWKCRRINLIVLNVALLALNLFNIIKML